MTEKPTKISVEEVMEAAAAGVLRALDARQAAAGGPKVGTEELIRAGFFVSVVIRAGGIPGPVELITGAELPGTAR